MPDPSFEVLAQIPAIEAKRLEAESRPGAARVAEEELRRDEAEAEGALAAAETSITAAVRGVVQAAAVRFVRTSLSDCASATCQRRRRWVVSRAASIDPSSVMIRASAGVAVGVDALGAAMLARLEIVADRIGDGVRDRPQGPSPFPRVPGPSTNCARPLACP